MHYGGGGGHRFMKVFHKIPVFFERWLPLGRALFMCGTFHILKNNKLECIELKEKAELRYLWDRAAGGYLSLIPVHS